MNSNGDESRMEESEVLVSAAQNYEGISSYGDAEGEFNSALYDPEDAPDPSVAAEIQSDFLSEDVQQQYSEARKAVAKAVIEDLDYEAVEAEPEQENSSGVLSSFTNVRDQVDQTLSSGAEAPEDSSNVAQRGIFNSEGSEVAQLVYEASDLAEDEDTRRALGYIAREGIRDGLAHSARNVNMNKTEYVIDDEVIEGAAGEGLIAHSIAQSTADVVEEDLEQDYAESAENYLRGIAWNPVKQSAKERVDQEAVDLSDQNGEAWKNFADDRAVDKTDTALEAADRVSSAGRAENVIEEMAEDSELVAKVNREISRNDEALEGLRENPLGSMTRKSL